MISIAVGESNARDYYNFSGFESCYFALTEEHRQIALKD
jgi:hypothetical protein